MRHHLVGPLAVLLVACSTVGTTEPSRTPSPEKPRSVIAPPEAAQVAEPEHAEAIIEPPVTAAQPARPAAPAEEKHAAMNDMLGDVSLGPLGMGNVSARGFGAGGMGTAGKKHGIRAPRITAGTLSAPSDGHAALVAAEGNTERYAHRSDNPFEKVADSPLSTFSIDVDTASYSNVRRFLREGMLPPTDAVRIEELLNYFRYDYAVPSADAPVAVSSEVSLAPWQPDHRLVRIGLRTRDIPRDDAPANNLVFLIDVSGSMQSPDKLPLLKRGLGLLTEQLRPQDRVAMVVYAGAIGMVLAPTSGKDKHLILAALERLDAGGSTNGAEGIRHAYEVARGAFVRGGVNRVILATDGDFNVGTTSEGELVRLIEEQRKSGVSLTVLGFGRGNLNDSSMEALADHGDGNYAYVDSIAEAHKVLVREAGSTLVTVAKDVKLQVEWNPNKVASYRLIGFENRRLAARDFNDDKKDAGELGAGHTVTALYEVTLTGHHANNHAEHSDVDPLRYQDERAPSVAADSDELLTVKIRYKRPDEAASRLMASVVRDAAVAPEQASEDFRWAAAVASFGMMLRGSEHRGQASLAMVRALARSATGGDLHGERHELIAMIDQAAALGIGRGDRMGDPHDVPAQRIPHSIPQVR